jgi:hypothetical protein
MGGVMPDHFQRFDILAGDDAQARIVLDGTEQVPGLTVHLHREGRLGEARPDLRRDLRTRGAARERHRLAVRQGYGHVRGRGMRRRHWLSPVG